MYKWDPEEALRLIEKERITGFNGVPSMSWDLINSPNYDKYDTSSVGVLRDRLSRLNAWKKNWAGTLPKPAMA